MDEPGRSSRPMTPIFSPCQSSSPSSGSKTAPRSTKSFTNASGYQQLEDKFILRGPALSAWLWDNRTVVTAGSASLASTAVSFPLDSLKARLQVRNYPRPAVWNCARTVFREEGIKGFTRGMAIPLVTISFVRTSSFSIYTYTKQALIRAGYFRDQNHLANVGLVGAMGGATSGMIISCGSAPFELVKVQRQLEYIIAMQSSSSSTGTSATTTRGAKYAPMGGFEAAKFIYQSHHGLRGFYLGFRLHLMRDTLGTTLYFGIYDSFRALIARQAAKQSGASAQEVAKGPVGLWGIPAPIVSFLNGSLVGITSWLLIYPLDLVKTRQQSRRLGGAPRSQTVASQIFLEILNAPPRGSKANPNIPQASLPSRFLRLYRGLGVSALRSFISHGITWLLIEYTTLAVTNRAKRDGVSGAVPGGLSNERKSLHSRPDSTVLE